ncbi:MAG TPA: hypothetical protein VIW64_05615, partial [Pyrinomonadaceae bacterium]
MLRKQTYARLAATLLRFRSAILMAAFLLFGIAALVIVPGTLALRLAAPAAAPAGESSCVLPGITVVTDAANDQSAAGAADQDLLSVSFAEPPDPVGDRLYVTMKVRGPVNPAALPPNTTWRTHFKHGAITWFVTVYSDQSSVVNYEYGQIDPTTGSNSTLGSADDGLVTADGTFEVIVSKSLVGSPAVGTNLTEIRGTVQKLVGAAGTGLLATIDRGPDQPALGAATYGSPYLVKGNASCGSATPTPTATPVASPTPPPGSCGAATFSVHMSPPGMADSWGEPSIGVNWKSEKTFNGTPNGGTVMSYGGINVPAAMKVTFDDTNPAAPVATWEPKTLLLPAIPRVLGDPILFTDHETGRTFVSQLLGGTKQSTMEFTDNDGDTFTSSQGSGINSGVDHQTIGGGPLVAPLAGNPITGGYKNGVWYCAQDVADANCALSLDGGQTF